MFSNVSNFKKRGDIGMSYAIAYYSKLGYTINIPLTDSQDYDFVLENNDSFLKVQVKTTDYKTKSGIYRVALRTCGGNKSGKYKVKKFDLNSSDLLFVLTGDGTCYSIQKEFIKATNTLDLGKSCEQFKVSL